ncbi:hypothetical protein M3Y94_00922700 [Aphelenchoides besseyi]|nr:hypothetical protein M3Y94_00922700 [Aphelenchoides besseyi]
MIVTERIATVGESYLDYGLGYYTDKKTQRLYFYVSYNRPIRGVKEWEIHRFDVNQVPLTWEFVGLLNIKMDKVGISPCGSYFWSIEAQPLGFHFIPQRIGFRQVDIETLNYVNFEVIGPTFTECKIEDIQLYNTNRGTFLLLHVTETLRRSTNHFDLIYHLHFNMEKQRVHLNHVQLPKLATTGPYPVPYSHSENWRTGLIEQNDSVYFYRVNYFGDLHFVEWEPNSISEWTKLVIHGSKRPKSWVVSTDRNLENHPLDSPNWRRSLNLLCNCSRYYATGGIFYEYDGQKKYYRFLQTKLKRRRWYLRMRTHVRSHLFCYVMSSCSNVF